MASSVVSYLRDTISMSTLTLSLYLSLSSSLYLSLSRSVDNFIFYFKYYHL